jgi:hypothetical protein
MYWSKKIMNQLISGGAMLGPTWAMARPEFGHNFDFLAGRPNMSPNFKEK